MNATHRDTVKLIAVLANQFGARVAFAPTGSGHVRVDLFMKQRSRSVIISSSPGKVNARERAAADVRRALRTLMTAAV